MCSLYQLPCGQRTPPEVPLSEFPTHCRSLGEERTWRVCPVCLPDVLCFCLSRVSEVHLVIGWSWIFWHVAHVATCISIGGYLVSHGLQLLILLNPSSLLLFDIVFWTFERWNIDYCTNFDAILFCPSLSRSGLKTHREGGCGWRFAANSSRSKIVTGQPSSSTATQHRPTEVVPFFQTSEHEWICFNDRRSKVEIPISSNIIQYHPISVMQTLLEPSKAEESCRFICPLLPFVALCCPLLPRQSQASTSRQSRCGSTWRLFCATCRNDPCGHPA